MERDHGPPAEGAASFRTTRWTILMRAAQSQAQAGQPALAELCRLYWYPLYIFAPHHARCCEKGSAARVSDPAENDEEIHALCEALIATEWWLGP